MKLAWKFMIFFSLMVANGKAEFTIRRGESGIPDVVVKDSQQMNCTKDNPTAIPISSEDFKCVNLTALSKEGCSSFITARGRQCINVTGIETIKAVKNVVQNTATRKWKWDTLIDQNSIYGDVLTKDGDEICFNTNVTYWSGQLLQLWYRTSQTNEQCVIVKIPGERTYPANLNEQDFTIQVKRIPTSASTQDETTETPETQKVTEAASTTPQPSTTSAKPKTTSLSLLTNFDQNIPAKLSSLSIKETTETPPTKNPAKKKASFKWNEWNVTLVIFMAIVWPLDVVLIGICLRRCIMKYCANHKKDKDEEKNYELVDDRRQRHRNANDDIEAPLLDSNKNKQKRRNQDTDLYDLVHGEDEQSVGSFDNDQEDIEQYQPTKKYVNIKDYENVNNIPDQSTNPIDHSPYEDITNEKVALISGNDDSIPHYDPNKRQQLNKVVKPHQEVDAVPLYQPSVSENNYETLPNSPQNAPPLAPRTAPSTKQPENAYEPVPNQMRKPVPYYQPGNGKSSSNYDTIEQNLNQKTGNNTSAYEPVEKYTTSSSNHYDRIKGCARIEDENGVVPQYTHIGKTPPQGGFDDGIYDSVADKPNEPDHIKDLYAVVDKSRINKKK